MTAGSEPAMPHLALPRGVRVLGAVRDDCVPLLSPAALTFVADLERAFRERRSEILQRRRELQKDLDSGAALGFRPETRHVREGAWTIAPVPNDLLDRRVEITGPVERKMIINALNSGANVFMADFEDSCSPTWENVVASQKNLYDAVRRTIEYTHPTTGKQYRLGERLATLVVRPRGWHMVESHVTVDGEAVSASLFDFGLYFFHNAPELLQRGSGPYFYLPKLESHVEARLWNDVFREAQRALAVPQGTIKATVLIETLPAAFEMDEILYELRQHSAGLNCGRWDYIFSFIKKLRSRSNCVLPDRGSVGMDQHFLRSYSLLAVRTCHRREAHAIGGMAAQIPIKDDLIRNGVALQRVREDKRREARDGHDGTWVAHPALVKIAREEFDAVMRGHHQIHLRRDDVEVGAADLLRIPQGDVTEAGLRQNLSVGVQYLAAWLCGKGCVPLYDLMEDAATAEISRAQVWQWLHHGAHLKDGRRVDAGLVRRTLSEELAGLKRELGAECYERGRYQTAAETFERLVLADELAEFLTLEAYPLLEAASGATRRRPTMQSSTHQNGSIGERADWEQRRFAGIQRDFTPDDVARLSGSMPIRYTLAEHGARRLWDLMHEQDYVHALGALTGNQAMQMVRAGLKAIYLSGWQVAADANLAGQMYPDQSLYPSDSVPHVVKRINQCLQRADQIAHSEGDASVYWFAPIVADAEAGFGGPLNAFELMKAMIEAGAAGVHFEDQLASEKKCGHLGGKVLVPTQTFVRTLNAARLAADVMRVPTVLIARTDANAAGLITSDVDERDLEFLTGERTPEGFFCTRAGLEQAIARGLSYAPYADLVWCETSKPDLDEARRFAEAIQSRFPGKLLAYNCSPSFNWKRNLDDETIARFQRELGAMGYKFQFVTLAGFHSLNHGMFRLAKAYARRGMAAYSELQQAEFASEQYGYSATRHQHEVGTGYFDAVAQAIAGGNSSTTALTGSTEAEQFRAGSAGSDAA